MLGSKVDLRSWERLVAAGSAGKSRATDGQTALDIARGTKNRDLEMLLVQAGAQL